MSILDTLNEIAAIFKEVERQDAIDDLNRNLRRRTEVYVLPASEIVSQEAT